MAILKIVLTASLSLIAMFIITKLMGHKQISQLDFFDYVNGITIGSIAAEMATDIEAPWKSLLALAIYGAASVLLNIISQKIMKSRKYINGSPTILMNDGKIYRDNLKKSKLELSEFMLLCREGGYFDLGDIKTAIFEHNGKVSILPRSECRPLTPKDVKIGVKDAHIATEIIMDGIIMGENLSRLGLDEGWLGRRLSEYGYHSAKEVFLALYYPNDDSFDVYE